MQLHGNIHSQADAFQKQANAIRREHGIEERHILTQTEPIFKDAKEQLKGLFTKGNKTQTRVLITGLPRTGTGYVSNLLESHPNSFTKGEVFDPVKHRYKNYVHKAQELAAKRPHELFSLKFLLFQSPNYLNDLMELGNLGWKIIGLHRKDTTRQSLSYYLSTAFNTFHRQGQAASYPKIKINIDLLNEVQSLFKESELQLINDYKTLGSLLQTISFEKDIVAQPKCIDLVSSFLGMPADLFKESEQPTFPNKWQLITNVGEVNDMISSQLR